MEIIPVIDLLQGQVVRAQRGERSRYRPIHSALCDSSETLKVAEALLGLYPFKTLYIADLDAIQNRGSNLAAVDQLQKSFPDITIWLDSGSEIFNQIPSTITQVIGSEALKTIRQYMQVTKKLSASDAVLSLDYSSNGFSGPAELLQTPSLWPQRLISMTLARVGSYEGPDFGKLDELLSICGERQVYAAGGIREARDLHQLNKLGIAGALLASSLHDGRIDSAEIGELMA